MSFCVLLFYRAALAVWIVDIEALYMGTVT